MPSVTQNDVDLLICLFPPRKVSGVSLWEGCDGDKAQYILRMNSYDASAEEIISREPAKRDTGGFFDQSV